MRVLQTNDGIGPHLPAPEVAAGPLASVVIITRNRPEMLRRCLEHLRKQDYRPFETIVVDSSDNEETRTVTDQFPDVRYLYLPDGKNKMPSSRNLGIRHARGDIVAFIDDDSMVPTEWLRQIVAGYTSPAVGGVGGRVMDEEEKQRIWGGEEAIGKILANGRIVANFILDPGRPVEVDHLRGCNMSFQRAILEQLGGFDPNYTGGNYMEDADMGVRVRKAGYSLIFNPLAAVEHLAARREGIDRSITHPSVTFYGARNRTYFFFKNFGVNRRTLRHIFVSMQSAYVDIFRKSPNPTTLLAVFLYPAGAVTGAVASVRQAVLKRLS